MFRFLFLKAFDRQLRDLPAVEKEKAKSVVGELLDYFNGGPKPLGLGLRKLGGSYWEVRVSLNRRIVFSLLGGAAVFAVIGSHDDVRRFLARRG